MNVNDQEMPRDATRDRLLAAAASQFAERGFYGASIAQIAGEVDLTKQALLYHFKRKEDLYKEVLKRIAVRLLAAIRSGVNENNPPEQQFEEMILSIYAVAMDYPDDTKVLMRELLDDQRSDAPPSEWFVKQFLDEIVGVLDTVAGLSELPSERKFARVYLLLSAIQYFAASKATLTRFYGEEEYAQIAGAYPTELRAQVHRLLQRGDT